jgi:AraC-like DNA-binding protein
MNANVNIEWLAKANIEWLAKATDRLGVDLPAVLHDLTRRGEVDSGCTVEHINFRGYLRLMAECEQQSGDSDIALHIGEQVDFSELGTYGHVILYAATVEEFLCLIERYERLLAQVNTPRFVRGEHTSRLQYHVRGPTEYPIVNDIAMTLASYTIAMRNYIGPEWQPFRVGFEFSSPQDVSEYQRIFGERLLFDQPISYIEVQNEVLHTKIRNIEPELLQLVTQYIDQLIEQAPPVETVYERVKALLIAAIGNETVDQTTVAQRLHMSRASLQRQLAAEGTSFRRLREEVVFHLARQALTNTSSSVSVVAQMLGYSESSAFNHAFTRLSGGLTPLQYRRQAVAG